MAGSLALLIALYWTTVQPIAAEWSSNPLGHGYLVIAISAYLVWTRRRLFESSFPEPSRKGLVLLGAAALLWLLASLSGTRLLEQLSLVAMLVGLFWCVLGIDALRPLMFPLTLLLFALPIGDRVIPGLQELTARFAVMALQMTGVPVLLEGHVISIPGSSWRVAEACSGINYLMSSLTVGYVYAGLAYRYWWHRIGFVLAAALIPLAANGVRVFTTIFIASRGATGIAAGLEHDLYGWLVFAITMGLLFYCCGGWSEDERARVPVHEIPVSMQSRSAKPASLWRLGAAAALALIVVAAAPLSARLLDAQSFERPSRPGVSAPWAISPAPWLDWTPQFESDEAQHVDTYESAGRIVRLHVAQFSAKNAGEVVTARSELVEAPWWLEDETDRSVIVAGRVLQVRELHLQAQSASMVVWSWYMIDGTPTANDLMAKLLAVKARLFRSRRGSSAIVLATRVSPGEDPVAVLDDFVGHLALAE